MLSAIKDNLQVIKQNIKVSFTKSLDTLFENYFLNLESFSNDEVYFSNLYQCTQLNEYIKTDILYMNRRFLEEIEKFILDLPNSRNLGSCFTYADFDDFVNFPEFANRNTHSNDIAILRESSNATEFELNSKDFTAFIDGISKLTKLTKLSLDLKSIQWSAH